MGLRAILAALAVALVLGACGSLLVGSKCDQSHECGAGLECVANECVEQGSSTGADAAASSGDTGAVPGADVGSTPASDAAAVGADAGGAGADAAAGMDAGLQPDVGGTPGPDASVQPGPDASIQPGPDAAVQPGPDVGVPGPDASSGSPDTGNFAPTRECGDVGWCQAYLPNDAGTPAPLLSTVSGYRDWGEDYYFQIWVGGKGPKMLKWNTKRWEDWSPKFVADAMSGTTKYPSSEVNVISTNYSYAFWGGLDVAGAGSAQCGWESLSSSQSTPYFGYQSYCSGSGYGNGWLGGYQAATGSSVVLVGKKGGIYFYPHSTGDGFKSDVVTTDYYAAHFFDSDEVWIVGAAGQVRFKPSDYTNSQDAKTARAFPATSANLYAVMVFPDALFVGGEGILYECDRSGDIGTAGAPILANCGANVLQASSTKTIRGFAGPSRNDMWAVGHDTALGKGFLLVRTAKGTWIDKTPTPAPPPLYGIWRDLELSVLVGDNATILSRMGPP